MIIKTEKLSSPFYQATVHKRNKQWQEKSCILSYIGLSLGTENGRFIDFSITTFIMLFNILWQAFHIPLYCFAGFALQAVYVRNPELLISIYKGQEYVQSLHVFGIHIMRTLELHVYNLYMFNYAISVIKRNRKRGQQQLTWCEFCLPFTSVNPTQEWAWDGRLEGIFFHSNLSSHMPLRAWAL